MYSNSVREYTQFVAKKLNYPEIDDTEIDRIMFSWGLKPDATIEE